MKSLNLPSIEYDISTFSIVDPRMSEVLSVSKQRRLRRGESVSHSRDSHPKLPTTKSDTAPVVDDHVTVTDRQVVTQKWCCVVVRRLKTVMLYDFGAVLRLYFCIKAK